MARQPDADGRHLVDDVLWLVAQARPVLRADASDYRRRCRDERLPVPVPVPVPVPPPPPAR
jgi:hypothetical protein